MMILAKMDTWQTLVALVLIVVCVALMIIVLLQRGRGGGVAAAFGGGGGGSSAFGAKTGDVFTLFTVILATVYLLIAVAGNFLFVPPEGLEASQTARAGSQPGQPAAPAPTGDAGRSTPARDQTRPTSAPPAADQPAEGSPQPTETTRPPAAETPPAEPDAAADAGTGGTGQDSGQQAP